MISNVTSCEPAVSPDGTTGKEVHVGICPYFKKDRGKGNIACEGANFHFPDLLARREFVYRFCAHPQGYKTCALKIAMDHFYERKYTQHE